MKLRRVLASPALAALLVFLLSSDVAWFHGGGAPLHWDSAIHLRASLDANRALDAGPGSLAARGLDFTWYYPPFAYWAAIPFHRLLGESELAGLLTMAFFHLLLVVATYGLGATLFSPAVGFLSALWIGTIPIVLDFSRQFMLDLPLAALVTLAIELLVRTDSFRNRRLGLLSGVVLGWGVLTKWTFVCFLLVPFVWTACAAVPRELRRQRRWNVIWALVVAAVVALPWYARHIVPILTSRSGELHRDTRSWPAALGYYLGVLPEQLSWLGFMAALAGVAVFLWRRNPRRRILIWFGAGYLLLTAIDFKVARFSLPLLPLLLVAASAGLESWKQRTSEPRWRIFAVDGLMVLLLVQAVAITFVPSRSGLGRILSQRLAGVAFVPVSGPRHDDWRQRDILDAVQADLERSGARTATLRIIPDRLFFNRPTFDCVAALERQPITITGIAGIPFLMDYTVLATGDQGEGAEKRSKVHASIAADTTGARPLYRTMGRFRLPDGTESLLLRTAREPAAGATADSVRTGVERLADQLIRRYLKPSRDYEIEVGEFAPAATLAGRLQSIRVRAAAGEIGDFAYRPEGVEIEGLDLELRGVQLNPVALAAHELQVVSIEELALHGLRIEAAALGNYLQTSSKGRTRVRSITMRNGELHLAVDQTKPRLQAELGVRLSSHDDNISFAVRSARFGPLPFPATLLQVLTRAYDPLLHRPEAVGRIRLGELRLEDDVLSFEPPRQ